LRHQNQFGQLKFNEKVRKPSFFQAEHQYSLADFFDLLSECKIRRKNIRHSLRSPLFQKHEMGIILETFPAPFILYPDYYPGVHKIPVYHPEFHPELRPGLLPGDIAMDIFPACDPPSQISDRAGSINDHTQHDPGLLPP